MKVCMYVGVAPKLSKGDFVVPGKAKQSGKLIHEVVPVPNVSPQKNCVSWPHRC
jgi:hypothetical protein